jgi:protein-tyrosine phosphatase
MSGAPVPAPIRQAAMETRASYSVLFVCMGNICRSPTAEGVFRTLVAERAPDLGIEIDSAGTHDYHVGDPPDRRAIAAASRRGVDLRSLRARVVEDSDFERFDLVIAMDRLNRAILLDRSPAQYRERVRLFLEFAPAIEEDDVPDPYYGGPVGFEHVLDLAEEASRGLLGEVMSRAAARR